MTRKRAADGHSFTLASVSASFRGSAAFFGFAVFVFSSSVAASARGSVMMCVRPSPCKTSVPLLPFGLFRRDRHEAIRADVIKKNTGQG